MLENRDIYWRTSENLNQNNRPEVIFDGYLEMTLRQTLVLSEGISQLCKYLVWFGLVGLVWSFSRYSWKSFRFDVEKGLRNKLRTLNQETLPQVYPLIHFTFPQISCKEILLIHTPKNKKKYPLIATKAHIFTAFQSGGRADLCISNQLT